MRRHTGTAHQPSSLCLLGGYSTSRSCVWHTVEFTVFCRPAGNGVRTPHSHPRLSHPLPKQHISIMISAMTESTCWCHLCPYVFTGEYVCVVLTLHAYGLSQGHEHQRMLEFLPSTKIEIRKWLSESF